jgi:C4-dicarboxylate-specific signal transduction histidine kinase
MQQHNAAFRGEGFGPVALGPLIADTLATRRAALDGVAVRTEVSAELPHVLGHRGHLADAIGQLLDNAVAAMRDRPERTVVIAAASIEGELLKVSVTDTGTGIPPEFVAKVFEPFATTKADWRRPGLGLAIVQRIVDAHKGTIRVERTSPEGTAIAMYLPAARGAHMR